MSRALHPIACAGVLALAPLWSGCTFWDMSDWSDRTGEEPHSSACTFEGVEALFCDDFDTPGAAWSGGEICDGCSAEVTADTTGSAPSPPNVFSVLSVATELGGGASYITKGIPGDREGASVHYAFFPDHPDPISEACVEEFGLDTGDAQRVRVRLWLSGDSVRVDTKLEAPELAESSDEEIAVVPLIEPRQWHRVELSVARLPLPPTVTVVIDDQTIADQHPIFGGEYLTTTFSNVFLRNGVRYVGVATEPAGWRVLIDDIAITSP